MNQQQRKQQPNPYGFGTGSNLPQRMQQQSNSFGFGTGSTRSHQSNPFGFGTGSTPPPQQSQQQKQSNSFGSGAGKQSHHQTFGNKWIRSVNAPPSQPTDSQPLTVSHSCEDPNVCKQLILEDLTNERPLWKLTCYGHFRGLPCDIHGDMSYEELRTAAYNDSKKGLSLQLIVERERELLNSKLADFEKLLRSPYVISKSHTTLTSFSNQSASLFSPPGSTAFQAFSSGFSGSPFLSDAGQKSPFQVHSPITNSNEMISGAPGFGGGQNVRFTAVQTSPIFQHFNLLGDAHTNGLMPAVSLESKGESELVDAGVWLKEKWKLKEIPEEEPPSRYCFD